MPKWLKIGISGNLFKTHEQLSEDLEKELKEDKMIMKDAQERADESNKLNSIKLKLKEFQGRTYKILKKEMASNFSCPITWRDESGKVITHMSYDVQEALMVMKLLTGEMNINDLKVK